MKFVIRDDDLNFFSKSADIERWYVDIFAQQVPVGFSAIPFVKPVSDVYTGGTPFENREYPIIENKELIEYVKGHPLVEVLQHGTTHETKESVFEYQQAIDLADTAQRGKQELQTAFGEKFQPIFVPPHDWIGRSGVYAVEAAGMDIIRGRGAGLRNIILRAAYARIFVRMLVFKAVHALRGHIPAYPYVLDFGKHKEVCSYRLEDEDVFEGLAYAANKDGVFVVVTHLHFYTEEKKLKLRALIEAARERKAEFVAPSALFN